MKDDAIAHPNEGGAQLEPVSSYDMIAEYYDFDMGLNNPGKDIVFYRDHAARARGPVLELGCGTGRITIPLVKAGCRVTGLDSSRAMLEQMQRKIETQLSPEEKGRLNYFCMDMREFDLPTKFALIICPFAAFTYLVEERDQIRFFQRVKKHLDEDGLFIVDSFVPHHDVCCLPSDHVFFDYRREIKEGIFLERHKTINQDLTAQISIITRHYRVLTADGAVIKSFSAQDTIRFLFAREMKLLLELNGFAVLRMYGDYEFRPYSYDASMMVFVTKPQPMAEELTG